MSVLGSAINQSGYYDSTCVVSVGKSSPLLVSTTGRTSSRSILHLRQLTLALIIGVYTVILVKSSRFLIVAYFAAHDFIERCRIRTTASLCMLLAPLVKHRGHEFMFGRPVEPILSNGIIFTTHCGVSGPYISGDVGSSSLRLSRPMQLVGSCVLLGLIDSGWCRRSTDGHRNDVAEQ